MDCSQQNRSTRLPPNALGARPLHPHHLSTRGGFPPQKVNKCAHLEVPTGMLTQPLWHTLPSPGGLRQCPNLQVRFTLRQLHQQQSAELRTDPGHVVGSSCSDTRVEIGALELRMAVVDFLAYEGPVREQIVAQEHAWRMMANAMFAITTSAHASIMSERVLEVVNTAEAVARRSLGMQVCGSGFFFWGGAGCCFNFHSGRGGGPLPPRPPSSLPWTPSPPPPSALIHLRIRVLGRFFRLGQFFPPVPSAHL